MNLHQWRTKEDLTMVQAAERLGITQPTISRIESGDQRPTFETVEALSEKSGGEITGPDLYAAWEAAQRTKVA